jgi:Alginate export
LKAFLACFLFLFLASSAMAQSDPAPIEIGGVNFSGTIRERYYAWDWFQPTTANAQNLYGYSGTLMRFSFSQTKQNFDWNIEFAVPVLLGVPNRAVLPAPQGQLGLGAADYAANNNEQYRAFIFPKQAFVRFKWDHSSLRAGRFEFTDGSELKPDDPTLVSLKNDRIGQRLIGTFGFSDMGRSMDGLHFAYTKGSWNFTAVSAIPTRGVFQVDGWGWVDTPITYTALTHEVGWGDTHAEWRLFGLFYNDDRNVLKTDNRPTAARAADHAGLDIGTYGGHFISDTATRVGTFDVLGWGALQTGRWGSLTQKAGAGAIEAGWQPRFAERVRPWFRGGYFYSSGDSNPNDGTHGTFFAVLPTPRVYARFPFFNEMNNRDAFGEVMLRPTKSLVLRSDIHGLWLAQKGDLWYTGGGAFQPWTFGFSGRPSNGNTGLATLYDISGDYKIGHGLSLGLYFGYAVGSPVIQKIYTVNSNGALGFTELNYHF